MCLQFTAFSFPLLRLQFTIIQWLNLKKGKVICVTSFGIYRLLSNSKAKPIMTTMRMALPMPKTYVSVIGAGVAVGTGVASGASSTVKAVTACDGQ